MTTPLITVLLPVHNAAAHCEDAVRSVLAQEVDDFELLIVDDGSSDGTPSVLRRIRDPRVRILEQAHEGLTAALCHGLREARGQFVARQDGDDRSRADRFGCQLQYLEVHPEVALVGSGVTAVDDTGRILGQYTYPTDHETIVHELFRILNPLPHTTIMFRRREIDACGGYRRCFQKAQDYDLLLRVSERHRLGSVPEPLCDLRHSMLSVTFRGEEGQQFECAMLALVSAVLRRSGRGDPLDSQADGFMEGFRAWYQLSAGPPAFRSRGLRRAARLAWADRRPVAAVAALTRSIQVDPWWLAERFGFKSNRIADEAVQWARAHEAGVTK